ncbi:response regulator [Myxosarcina sp. GI1]|uniref:response regulator n=1 Tax=Myxosarcina sp. GI1 TaxID=1541065 RepID=UPI00068E2E65|nr:response regulator [Myxosarcina sp. GI1]
MNQVQGKFYHQLIYLKQKQFTGKIIVQFEQITTWYICLRLGRLVWTSGGIHPNRAWKRAIDKYCPHVNWKELEVKNFNENECPNYSILKFLFEKQLIDKENASELIKIRAIECLFDILQIESKRSLKISLEPKSASSFLVSTTSRSVALIDIEDTLNTALQTWLKWQQKGLADWSPNLAPMMNKQNELREEVSGIVYQNFLRLLDGRQTLRDLSYRMDKEVHKLSYTLVPYIKQGLLTLLEVKDIEPPRHMTQLSTRQQQNDSNVPLIACVDDSPQICKIMEQIITKQGYRFISIQEPLQALPALIKDNPSLIFLDIGMPVVNGYEICAQVRRVSKLKNTPIIFLTGNDGIVDRMRAKVVGADAFVAKPIEIEKIIAAIEKNLKTSSKVNKFIASNNSSLVTE